MTSPFWHKQTAERPLYPVMLWSRPENRLHAGKLLVIGGNAHGFMAPAEAFAEAAAAGVGVTRVLLPDVLQKTVGKIFADGGRAAAKDTQNEFCWGESTPSGSFAQAALAEFLECSRWAHGVLLAGDFGKNSETAIVLEKFTAAYSGQLTIANDAADYCIASPQKTAERGGTTLIVSLAQLQKLSASLHFPQAFTSDMGLLHFVGALHDFTETHKINIVTAHLENIFVAADGQVSSTKIREVPENWQTKTAAHASTWWLQNPGKTFAALTTGVL